MGKKRIPRPFGGDLFVVWQKTFFSAGSFNTLVAAVKAAGLVETLSGPGPFTVFAPTDEALAQIPEADLNALLADKEALTAILTYHVVAGKVMAADVVKKATAATRLRFSGSTGARPRAFSLN